MLNSGYIILQGSLGDSKLGPEPQVDVGRCQCPVSAGRGGGFQRVCGTSLSWSPSLTPGCLSLCLGPCQASSRHTAVTVGCARTQPPRPPSLRTPSTLSVSLGPDPWNSPTLLSPARTRRSAAHSAHTVSGGSAASQAQRWRPACLVTQPVRDTGPLPGDCPPAVAPGGRHVCALSGVHTQAPNTACDADHPPRERAATHTHTGALTRALAALQHPQMLSLPQFPQQTDARGDLQPGSRA